MTDMHVHLERTYDLPPEALWQVVGDLAGYADHVADLAASPVLSGSGAGAVRRCETTKGQSWTEQVTRWEDGRSYQLAVDTRTYPFPLKQLFRAFGGTWTVDQDGSGSRVSLTFEADVRGGVLARPLIALVRRKFVADLEETLTSYGEAARRGEVAR